MAADTDPGLNGGSLRRLDDRELEAKLRELVDEATCVHGSDNQDVAGWTNRVSTALHTIRAFARGRRSHVVLKVAEYSVVRLAQTDDGIVRHCSRFESLLDRAQKIHLAAAKAARPDPVELAQFLCAFERGLGYGLPNYSFRAYAAVLGTAGLAEYQHLARLAWAALPPRTGASTGGPPEGVYWRLLRVLDDFAKADGDVDARIALRTKDLSSPMKYDDLVRFCLALDRPHAALAYAEEGSTLFAGEPHTELARLTARLLAERGRRAGAQLKLRNALVAADIGRPYYRHDVRTLCAELCAFGGPSRKWLIAQLEAKIVSGDRRSRAHWGDILLEVLLHAGMFEAALNAARRFPCSLDAKERVARQIEPAFPAQAIELYEDLVVQRLAKGNSRHFISALALLRRLAEVHGEARHQAYVCRLKERFARREGVMKTLNWIIEHGMRPLSRQQV